MGYSGISSTVNSRRFRMTNKTFLHLLQMLDCQDYLSFLQLSCEILWTGKAEAPLGNWNRPACRQLKSFVEVFRDGGSNNSLALRLSLKRQLFEWLCRLGNHAVVWPSIQNFFWFVVPTKKVFSYLGILCIYYLLRHPREKADLPIHCTDLLWSAASHWSFSVFLHQHLMTR